MRKRLSNVLVALTLAALICCGFSFFGETETAVATDFATWESGGAGTSESPFNILSADDLMNVYTAIKTSGSIAGVTASTANYKVTADIDMTEKTSYNGLGTGNAFAGTFDGGNHTITLNITSGSAVGLIGTAGACTIKNVVVAGLIKGSSSVGAIVGKSTSTATLNNCISRADVKGSHCVAAIIGYPYSEGSTTIENCYNEGTVQFVGGAQKANYPFWAVLYGYASKTETGSTRQTITTSGQRTTLNVTGAYTGISVFNANKSNTVSRTSGSGSTAVTVTSQWDSSMGVSETKIYGTYGNYGGQVIRFTTTRGYVYVPTMDRTCATFRSNINVNLDEITAYPVAELSGITYSSSTATVNTASQLEHLAWIINGNVTDESVGGTTFNGGDSIIASNIFRKIAYIKISLGTGDNGVFDLTQSKGVFGRNNFYGIGWSPMAPYLGGLIGNNKTIVMDLDYPEAYAMGFFGCVSSYTSMTRESTFSISDVTFEGKVSGKQCVGSAVGLHDNYAPSTLFDNDRKSNINISGVTNNADVSGQDFVGGILGESNSAKNDGSKTRVAISNTTNNGDVTGTGSYGTGGIVGGVGAAITGNVSMTDVTNNGDVTGTNNVGGLAGMMYSNSSGGGNITTSGTVENNGTVSGTGTAVGTIAGAGSSTTTALNTSATLSTGFTFDVGACGSVSVSVNGATAASYIPDANGLVKFDVTNDKLVTTLSITLVNAEIHGSKTYSPVTSKAVITNYREVTTYETKFVAMLNSTTNVEYLTNANAAETAYQGMNAAQRDTYLTLRELSHTDLNSWRSHLVFSAEIVSASTYSYGTTDYEAKAKFTYADGTSSEIAITPTIDNVAVGSSILSCTVTRSYTANGKNYEYSATITKQVQITEKLVNITITFDKTKNYDGTTVVKNLEFWASSVILGDELQAVVTAVYDSVSVGTSAVSLNVSLSGESEANYKTGTVTVNGTITSFTDGHADVTDGIAIEKATPVVTTVPVPSAKISVLRNETLSDISLSGGEAKATINGVQTVISGTFAFIDGTQIITENSTCAVTFTPSVEFFDRFNETTCSVIVQVKHSPTYDVTATDTTYAEGAYSAEYRGAEGYNFSAKRTDGATATVAYSKDGSVVDKPANRGVYVVTVSTAEDENYEASSIICQFTIIQKGLIFEWAEYSATYSGSAQNLTASVYSGLLPGDAANAVIVYKKAGAVVKDAIGAGSYTAELTAVDNDNYTVSAFTGTDTAVKAFEISPKTLTVTAQNVSKKYKEGIPEFTYTTDGFVGGETAESLSFTASISTDATETSPVSDYTITVGTCTALENYTVEKKNGVLTIEKADGTVNIGGLVKTYNATQQSPSVIVTNDENYTLYYSTDNEMVASAPTAAGAYGLEVRDLDNENYNWTVVYAANEVGNKFVINRKQLTASITTTNFDKIYDATNTAKVSATLSGTEGTDIIELTVTAVYRGEVVAEYVIDITYEISGAASDNYLKPASTTASGTINKATPVLSVTDRTVTYDRTPKDVSWQATFVNGETFETLLTYNGSTTEPTAVGEYAVSLNFSGNENYNSASATGTLTINQIIVTAEFGAYDKTYNGQEQTLTVTLSGIVSGDTVTAAISYKKGGFVESPKNAGSYVATLALSGADIGNYKLDKAYSTEITIKKATATVNVTESKTIEIGETVPEFDYTVTGLQNGTDSVDGYFTVVCEISGIATATGTYDVWVEAEGTHDNYDIADNSPATLIVNVSQNIRITAKAQQTTAYTRETKAVTYEIEVKTEGVWMAQELSEYAAYVSVSYKLNGDETEPIGAGNYAVTITLKNHPSYVNTTATCTLMITAVQLTANDYLAVTEKVYDGTVAAAIKTDGQISGIIEGDEVNVTATAAYNAATVLGANEITISYALAGADASNYFSPAADTCEATITPKPLTLRFTGNDAVYYNGAEQKNIVATAEDVVLGEIVTLELTYEGEVINAGTYIATATISDTNYSLTGSIKASIEIKQIELTVAADDKERKYREETPELTYTISGFVEGESSAIAGITGTPVLATEATKNSPVIYGGYDITVDVSGMSAENYTFKAEDGTLTVTKRQAEIRYEGLTKTYNGAGAYAAIKVYDTETDAEITVDFDVTYDQDGNIVTPRAAGSYSLTVTADETNYEYTNLSATFNIEVYGLTASDTMVQKIKSYDGTKVAEVIVVGSIDTFGTDDVTLSAKAEFNSKNVSDASYVTVTYSISGADSANYAAPASFMDTEDVSITRASVNFSVNEEAVTADTVFTAVYDKTEHTVTADVFGLGEIIGTAVSNGYTNSCEEASLTFSYEGDNFSGAQSAKLTVLPKFVAVTQGVNKPYNGLEQEFSATVAAISGDIVNVNLDYFDDGDCVTPTTVKNVGSYYAKATLSNANYVIDGADILIFRITAVELTVKAQNATRKYLEKNPTFGYDVSGLVGGETLATADVTGEPQLNTAALTESDVGKYAITIQIGTLTSNNYTFKCVNGELIVTQRAANITVTQDTVTYNGEKQEIGFKVFDDETDVTGAVTAVVVYDGLMELPKEGGKEYAFTITLAASGNYSGSTYGTFTIQKKQLSVDIAESYEKEYDGNKALSIDAELSGVCEADKGKLLLEITANFASANAGLTNPVTVEYLVTEADGVNGVLSNYFIPLDTQVSGRITQASVEIAGNPEIHITYGDDLAVIGTARLAELYAASGFSGMLAGAFSWTRAATSVTMETRSAEVVFTPDDPNFETKRFNADIVPDRANIEISASSEQSFDYRGESVAELINATLKFKGAPLSAEYVYSIDADGANLTAATTYSVKIIFSGTDEFLPSEKDINVTVRPLTIGSFGFLETGWTYNGRAQKLTAVGDTVLDGDDVVIILNIQKDGVSAEFALSGSYQVTAVSLDGADKENYVLSENIEPRGVTMDRARLLATLVNTEIEKGDELPAFSFTLSGLYDVDAEGEAYNAIYSAIIGGVSYEHSYSTSSPASEYPVMVTGNVILDNYIVQFMGGKIIVQKRSIGSEIGFVYNGKALDGAVIWYDKSVPFIEATVDGYDVALVLAYKSAGVVVSRSQCYKIGEYTVTATVDDENYRGTATSTYSVRMKSLTGLISCTPTKITIDVEGDAEFKLGDGNWQTSAEFNSLTELTEYTVYCRVADVAETEVQSVVETPCSAETVNYKIEEIEVKNGTERAELIAESLRLTHKVYANDMDKVETGKLYNYVDGYNSEVNLVIGEIEKANNVKSKELSKEQIVDLSAFIMQSVLAMGLMLLLRRIGARG